METIKNNIIENNIKNITIALDLDGTLISEISLSKNDPLIDIKLQILEENFDLLYEYSDYYSINLVYIRPYVLEFIKEIKKFTNIIVFTARERKSAYEVVSFIDPYNEFIEDIYDRNFMTSLNYLYQVKDLQVVSYKHKFINMKNIILIDDWWYNNNYLQLFNFLPIKQWSLERFNSSNINDFNDNEYLNSLINDNYIFDIILPFIKSLDNTNDVRNNIVQFHRDNFNEFGGKLIICLNKANEIINFYNEKNFVSKLHEDRISKFKNSLIKKNKVIDNNLKNRIYYSHAIEEIKYHINLYIQSFSN